MSTLKLSSFQHVMFWGASYNKPEALFTVLHQGTTCAGRTCVTYNFTERQPLGVQFSHNLRWSFDFYWCFTALPKALWQLCLWFMPVSLQYPTLGKNLGKTCRNQKNLGKTYKNLGKPQKKNLGKKAIFLDSLERGGPSQDSLKIVLFAFFVFSNVFFGFPRFLPVFPMFLLVLITFSHLHLFPESVWAQGSSNSGGL